MQHAGEDQQRDERVEDLQPGTGPGGFIERQDGLDPVGRGEQEEGAEDGPAHAARPKTAVQPQGVPRNGELQGTGNETGCQIGKVHKFIAPAVQGKTRRSRQLQPGFRPETDYPLPNLDTRAALCIRENAYPVEKQLRSQNAGFCHNHALWMRCLRTAIGG